ncbi:MAG: Phosphate regulon transcriptional regulatory protein PhoB (SphR) [uncultured Acidimicrobiales bacterium]|uniref:Phosphate regulon transcriptional regulatory protein PhoB (SphR) n=1 Tax=uncultured Acidimicrobiales bacterium TaxID=310071 RepID=A0A6J4IBK6_9ACTN|nr:MAG: Phosphate regulon transcriptional regulatory protein PhoB (SphR) [uncultured Acidimicrobiales bacterium]
MPTIVGMGTIVKVVTSPTSRVLVVDDDQTVSEVVRRYLEREGYEVETVADGTTALRVALAHPPDLMVLDLMLPGLDGIEVCRRLRQSHQVPVIMLTAKGDVDDRVTGLEVGADDYVTKPFSPRELTARVGAVLRRVATVATDDQRPSVLQAGNIRLDTASRRCWVDGNPVQVTTKELDLLAFLLRSPGRAWRREELLEHVWGWTYGDTSTVTVHIRRLREKVEQDPTSPRHLQTVWGVGYRFEAEP